MRNAEKKTTLVVAVTGPNRDNSTQRNDFGKKFNESARKLGVKTTHDGFETAMVELRSQDWRNFMEVLAD